MQIELGTLHLNPTVVERGRRAIHVPLAPENPGEQRSRADNEKGP